MGARGLDRGGARAEVQWGRVRQETSSSLTVFYQNVSVCVRVRTHVHKYVTTKGLMLHGIKIRYQTTDTTGSDLDTSNRPWFPTTIPRWKGPGDLAGPGQ